MRNDCDRPFEAIWSVAAGGISISQLPEYQAPKASLVQRSHGRVLKSEPAAAPLVTLTEAKSPSVRVTLPCGGVTAPEPRRGCREQSAADRKTPRGSAGVP